jgi:Domain of unknown function (DUF1707)
MRREDMRAGDADRQAVADRLKRALDEGRLDLSEYDERLQRAYAAKTFGDLDGLLTDLPTTAPPQHSQVAPYPVAAPDAAATPGGVRSRAIPYARVLAVCLIVWAITALNLGQLPNFWLISVVVVLALSAVANVAGHRSGRDARRAGRRERRNS